MTASEMTNEELAKGLELMALSHIHQPNIEAMNEAAARLRNPNAVKIGRQVKALADRNNALRAKLKVAEDALDRIYKCIDNRYSVDVSILAKNIIADALAAIREASGEGEVAQ